MWGRQWYWIFSVILSYLDMNSKAYALNLP